MRVVMAGPLPPAVGGMATVIDDVSRSSLSSEVDLVLFDTAKATPEDRSLWQGVVARFGLWRRWWLTLRGAEVAHIHTCSGFTYYLDGALLCLAKLRRVPVVLHIHGAQFDQFLDGMSRAELELARWLARRANRVVALSDAWRDILAKRLPRARLTVIENGVPVPNDIRARASGDQAKVLFLGNLSRRKGVWELVEAMHSVDDCVRVVLAGGEEDAGIGAKVNHAIQDEGLTAKIEWIGPVHGRRKDELLQECDIFVLPSHAEGLPISLLEAMCAGLPIVVTPVGAIPSVVEDGKHGLIIQPGDSQALAAALNELSRNRELRQRLGDGARSRCAQRYGVERAAQNYLRLYGELAHETQ